MPLDAICLRAVTNELNNVLAGCRVEKVYQPDRDEIVLQTRGGQGGPRRLLLSIAAGAPRVHFIDAARENPAAPPMFCVCSPLNWIRRMKWVCPAKSTSSAS